jgi:hypothetical protein
MDYTEEILAKLKSEAERLDDEGLSQLLDNSDLGGLVDTCYRASLITNETRYPKFRIQIIPAEPPVESRANRFAEPLRVNPKEINRISFAMSSDDTVICIIPSDGELLIWGLLLEADQTIDLSTKLVRRAAEFPHLLEIHVKNPGCLIFRKAHQELFRYEHGEIRSLMHFSDIGVIDSFIIDRAEAFISLAKGSLTFSGIFGVPEFDAGFVSSIVADYLKAVVTQISNLGHGGMVVVIPGDDTTGLGNSLQVDSRIVSRAISAYIGTQRQYEYLYEPGVLEKGKENFPALDESQFEGIRSHARTLAETSKLDFIDVIKQVTHLSSVDGAVVLDGNLDVIHIGAEIRIADPQIGKALTKVMIIDREGNKRPRKIDEKGTRHRSAYRFAMKNPDSLVMVISQDGPISVVKRVANEVHVWEDVST